MMEDGFCLRNGGINNRFLHNLWYCFFFSLERGNAKDSSPKPRIMSATMGGTDRAEMLSVIENIGIYLGPLLLLLSLYIMFRGHEKLLFAAGITGAGIGYVFTPLIHSQVEILLGTEVRMLYVLIVMVLLNAFWMALTIQITIRMMAVVFIYLIFSTVFEFLSANGYDFVRSNEISQIMGITAFFTARMIASMLPLLVSALLGSLGLMTSMLLISGNSLTMLSVSNNSSLLMVAVLFILSFSWQFNAVKKKKAKEKEEENAEMPQMRHVGNGNQIQSRQRRAGDLPDLRDFS